MSPYQDRRRPPTISAGLWEARAPFRRCRRSGPAPRAVGRARRRPPCRRRSTPSDGLGLRRLRSSHLVALGDERRRPSRGVLLLPDIDVGAAALGARHLRSCGMRHGCQATAVMTLEERRGNQPTGWTTEETHGRLHVTGKVMATTTPRKSTSRDKVRAHRERLRRRGLRPIQILGSRCALANVRSRSAAAIRPVAASTFEAEEQAFVDVFSEWNSE